MIVISLVCAVAIAPHGVFAGGGPAIDVVATSPQKVEQVSALGDSAQQEAAEKDSATTNTSKSQAEAAESAAQLQAEIVFGAWGVLWVAALVFAGYIGFVFYRFRRKNAEINQLLGVDSDIDKSPKND